MAVVARWVLRFGAATRRARDRLFVEPNSRLGGMPGILARIQERTP